MIVEPRSGQQRSRLQDVYRDDSSVARSEGFDYFSTAFPGVPLRSTPGFTLTPASRVEAPNDFYVSAHED